MSWRSVPEGEREFEEWLAGNASQSEQWRGGAYDAGEAWRGDIHYADWPWECAPPEWRLTGHWAPAPARWGPERYAVEKLIAHAFQSPTWSCHDCH